VQALGRRTAAALVGSSQGAAAVLNALSEVPALAQAMAVVHPVSHAPDSRYSSIPHPVLMLYDVDDPGHPVGVGRRLRQTLRRPIYHEYSSRCSGDWEMQQLPPSLLKMLRGEWVAISRSRGGGRPVDSLPELVRCAGGLGAWSGDGRDRDTTVCVEEEVESGEEEVLGVPRTSAVDNVWLEDSDPEEDAQPLHDEQLEREATQTCCDLCGLDLPRSHRRLERCRCALCPDCVDLTVRYTCHCPVCGDHLYQHGKTTRAFLSKVAGDKAAYDRCRVVVEYGNTCFSSGGGYGAGGRGKVEYSSFVRIASSEGLSKAQATSAITQVDFNINPDYKKPTASCRLSDRQGKFVFAYAMGRPFPCVMTVHWSASLQLVLPPLVIEYEVQQGADNRYRVVVDIPRDSLLLRSSHNSSTRSYSNFAGKKHKPSEVVVFKATPPRDGWVVMSLIQHSSQGSRSSGVEVKYIIPLKRESGSPS
jgi:hypothetical protein